MGVVSLWEVLKEVKRVTNLSNMRGKTLAVDLAIWICEAEGVKVMHISKPYLRNLFFRVKRLIKEGIKLLFVIDGVAPALKLDTIAQRLGERGNSKMSGVRNRLDARLKECCILLDSLGIPWIKAQGEAEALCATLNKHGLVDAVVTNDGDSFLYGAQTVYRNFSVDNKDHSIECYHMTDITEKWHLDQRGMVALGLLLGCDYCPKGVPGVGMAQAVKLLSSWKGQDPLDIFKVWRETASTSRPAVVQKKPPHCSVCNHIGLKRDHVRGGCDTCGTTCQDASSGSKNCVFDTPCMCTWHVQEQKRKRTALEDKVKSSALKDPKFPDQNIIREFLKEQKYTGQPLTSSGDLSLDNVLKAKFKSKAPTLDMACRYISEKMDWSLDVAVTKVLPIVTGYFLNLQSNEDVTVLNNINMQVELHSIIRSRVKDRVPSFEVKWSLTDRVDLDGDFELVTIEPEDLMNKVYPQAVQGYRDGVEKEKEEKKKAKSEARKQERKKKQADKTSPVKTKKITDFYNAKKVRNQGNAAETAPDYKELATSSQDIISPVETKKITDFYNAKKVRNQGKAAERAPDYKELATSSQGDGDIGALELSLASLSISEKNPPRSLTVHCDKEHKHTAVLHSYGSSPPLTNKSKASVIKGRTTSSSSVNVKERASVPVVIFSSDSESDFEDDSVVKNQNSYRDTQKGHLKAFPNPHSLPGRECNKEKAASLNYEGKESPVHGLASETTDQCSPMRNDITFSNQLDFSLGCSMMQTPIAIKCPSELKENNDSEGLSLKNNRDPSMLKMMKNNDKREVWSPLQEIDLNKPQSPGLSPSPTRNGNSEDLKSPVRLFLGKITEEQSALDSPVFMTLRERLEARARKT